MKVTDYGISFKMYPSKTEIKNLGDTISSYFVDGQSCADVDCFFNSKLIFVASISDNNVSAHTYVDFIDSDEVRFEFQANFTPDTTFADLMSGYCVKTVEIVEECNRRIALAQEFSEIVAKATATFDKIKQRSNEAK